MMKHVGKDKRGSLRRIQVKDSDGSIIQILINCRDMENAIIQYNKVYFQQVHQIKVYQGKIYDKMELDKIRDKIL